MARVTTEKKSFLDRLQQATQIGTSVMNTVQKSQEIGQRDTQIEQQGMQLELEKENAATQRDLWASTAEKNRLDTEAMRQELGTKQVGYLIRQSSEAFKGASKMEEKEQSQFYESYFVKNEKEITAAAKASGVPMDTKEDVQKYYKHVFVPTSKASFKLNSEASEINKILTSPSGDEALGRQLQDRFSRFQDNADLLIALLPKEQADVVRKEVEGMQSKISQTQSKWTNQQIRNDGLNERISKENQRQKQRDEDQAASLMSKATPYIKEPQEEMLDLQRARAMLKEAQAGAPMAMEIAQRFIALATNKGALSEADREAIKGSKAYLAQWGRKLQEVADGTATEQDLKLMDQIIGAMEKNSVSAFNQSVSSFAQRYDKIYPEWPKERIQQQFGSDVSTKPIHQNTAPDAASKPAGKPISPLQKLRPKK
jgi:hypothetical protein